jgi:hypothetical protein
MLALSTIRWIGLGVAGVILVLFVALKLKQQYFQPQRGFHGVPNQTGRHSIHFGHVDSVSS